MEYFIGQLQIMLPVLGVNAIRVRPTNPAISTDPLESPVFTLTNPKAGVHASAQQIDGEFTVLQGSRVVAFWRGISLTARSPWTTVLALSRGTLHSPHRQQPVPSSSVDPATGGPNGSPPRAPSAPGRAAALTSRAEAVTVPGQRRMVRKSPAIWGSGCVKWPYYIPHASPRCATGGFSLA